MTRIPSDEAVRDEVKRWFPKDFDLTYKELARDFAFAIIRDTLRQARELLDGIENPYNDAMTGCLSRDYRIKHTTFEKARQMIKALLEE